MQNNNISLEEKNKEINGLKQELLNLNNELNTKKIEMQKKAKILEKLQNEKKNLEQSLKNKEKEMKVQIMKETNNITTKYENRENYILNYFKDKGLKTIEKMEKNMNHNIDQFKNEIMNYINA